MLCGKRATSLSASGLEQHFGDRACTSQASQGSAVRARLQAALRIETPPPIKGDRRSGWLVCVCHVVFLGGMTPVGRCRCGNTEVRFEQGHAHLAPPAKGKGQLKPRLDVPVHVTILDSRNGRVLVEESQCCVLHDRQPVPARIHSGVLAVNVLAYQASGQVQSGIKCVFRLAKEALNDEPVVAGSVCGTIKHGGLDRSEQQAADRGSLRRSPA